LHPSGVAQSSTSFGWDKGGNVSSAGWQVTLCDPIWHLSSLPVAVRQLCQLLYTCYLLTYIEMNDKVTLWRLSGTRSNQRPHRIHRRDAAYSCRRRTLRDLCALGRPTNPAKTAETIRVPFEMELLRAQGTVHEMGRGDWRHLGNMTEQSVQCGLLSHS